MPKFKPYNQNQNMLLPPRLADCLPSDHIAFLISEVVNGLYLEEVKKTYSETGCPAYDPRTMIKILFYGHTQGITSSRKIEKNNYENNAFRFLSGNQQPDHGTISLFRKIHLKKLNDIFSQIVILCGRLDMMDMSDISIDGSKFKASASKKNLFTLEQIGKLKEKIGQALADAVNEDEKEDKRFGDRRGYNQIPEELADPEKRKKAIEKAKRKLEKIKKAEARIKDKLSKCKTSEERGVKKNNTSNTTDQDANLMKMKNGSYQMAYNVQLSSSDQIITGYDIDNDPSDAGQFRNMAKITEKITGNKIDTAKADAGYFSKEDLKFCQANNIDAYIPDQKKVSEEKEARENRILEYDRRNFQYDEKKDRFICPQGKFLIFFEKTGRKGRKYLGESCANCSVKGKCTKGKCRYLYYDPELEKLRKEMRAKLNTDDGKANYLERMSDIEPVYGNLKYNLRFTEFCTRGKPMVLIETGLYCIAHNLVKIFKHKQKEEKKGKKIQLNTLMRLQAAP